MLICVKAESEGPSDMAFIFRKNKPIKIIKEVVSNSLPLDIVQEMCEEGKKYTIGIKVNNIDYSIIVDDKKNIISVMKDKDAQAFETYLYWLQEEEQKLFYDASITKMDVYEFPSLEDDKAKDIACKFISTITVMNLVDLYDLLQEENHYTYVLGEFTSHIPPELIVLEHDNLSFVLNKEREDINHITKKLNISDTTVFHNVSVKEETKSSAVHNFITSAIVRDIPLRVMKDMSTGFFWSSILMELEELLENDKISIPHSEDTTQEHEDASIEENTEKDTNNVSRIVQMLDEEDFSYDTDVFGTKENDNDKIKEVSFESVLRGDRDEAAPDLIDEESFNAQWEPLAEENNTLSTPQEEVFFTPEEEQEIIDHTPIDNNTKEMNVTELLRETPIDDSKIQEAKTVKDILLFSLSLDKADSEEISRCELLALENIKNEEELAQLTSKITSYSRLFHSLDIENINNFFAQGDNYSLDEEKQEVSKQAFVEASVLEEKREEVISRSIDVLTSMKLLGERYPRVRMMEDVLTQRIEELINIKNTAFDSQREAERDKKQEFIETLEEIKNLPDETSDSRVEEEQDIPLPIKNTSSVEPSIFNELARKYDLNF